MPMKEAVLSLMAIRPVWVRLVRTMSTVGAQTKRLTAWARGEAVLRLAWARA